MESLEGLERLLAQHPFFKDMRASTRELIAGCASNCVFRDGDRILKEGDAADSFYLLRHGAVALEIHVPARSPLVIETLSDGDVLGWSWLVPPYRVRFDARAIGLVRALRINGRCLREKCEQDSDLGYELYKQVIPVIVDRLTAARLQMVDIYGHPTDYANHEPGLAAPSSPPAKPSPAGQGD
jgi:CRP/FNR family cyclic AMP-dependent transcriptional regulator